MIGLEVCSNLFGHSNKGSTGLLFLKAGSHYVANLLSTCNSQLHFYREIENFLSLHCYSPMQFCSNLSEPGFRYCNYPGWQLNCIPDIWKLSNLFFPGCSTTIRTRGSRWGTCWGTTSSTSCRSIKNFRTTRPGTSSDSRSKALSDTKTSLGEWMNDSSEPHWIITYFKATT